MRTESEIIGTYARVLFDLANAADDVDGADKGIATVVETVEGSRELKDALADDSITAERKRAIMSELFAPVASPEAISVATIMIERGHLDLLGAVADAYRETAERERGIVIAEVTTAVPLTEELRASIASKLSAALDRPVTLRERVDAGIVGGVVVKVAGRVLDGSLASQLDQVRAALSTAPQGGEG
jgi:F-type H+-transporting ATPase subunit delta